MQILILLIRKLQYLQTFCKTKTNKQKKNEFNFFSSKTQYLI